MAVPLLDLHRQYQPIIEEVHSAISKVFKHNRFIMGPEVQELEERIAGYVGAKHAIAVASGTDALLIALRALSVEPGDEVITTPFTFFATVGVISRLGAKPVFVDIDPDTFNMNPDQLEIAISEKTRAIIPIHLYGQCADMDLILRIARENNIPVVEDAAQAIGASYKGKSAGAMGDFGCFSFFPSKNLGAAGDAGMITTNDNFLDEMCRKLRVHGAKPKYYHGIVGYNSRLDTIQAAILMVKLNWLNKWHEGRRRRASIYDRLLNIDEVVTPLVAPDRYHIYHQYTVRVKDRDGLRNFLKENNIGCEIYYPLPLHMQECYNDLGYKEGSFPESEKAANEVLSLPIFPEMTDAEQEEVVDTIKKYYSK
ncbi:MAG: aminotransferase class V-fold PLP-dependent enzyme [candidate division Zixibacteria bacterium]|nr:aminotransferase class V-fold PLP-dependent enzyme [candidate division Zixibacteria bacterium]